MDSVSATTAPVVAMTSKEHQSHEKTATRTTTRQLGFREWIIHEPIAVVVMLTLLSVAVQRAAARTDTAFIRPAVDFVSTAWLPSKRAGTVSEPASQSSQQPQSVSHPQPASLRSKVSAAGCPKDPAPALFLSNVIALVLDLALGLALVYGVYSLLVHAGLRSRFGNHSQSKSTIESVRHHERE
jgi:hypothetical protein